jgi:LacI family transcriptional regulator
MRPHEHHAALLVVRFRQRSGARAATQRLIDFGHRRIALISAPVAMTFAAQRREGFVSALRDAGLAPLPELMVECAFGRAGGRDAATALLNLADPPTAVLVDNNLAGAGAFRAIIDSGRKPGRDVSLIVYDGVPSDVSHPYAVTAVMQPTGHASGRAIAELMLDAIKDRDRCAHRLALPRIEPGDTDGPMH